MRGLVACLILSLLTASAVVAADTTSAVVTGAELLYVRRGPGVGFPAFATIERGERVEVERLDGVWALVHLASGQSGYVHSTFLSFPGESRATIIVPATATATPARQPETTAGPEELPSPPTGSPTPTGTLGAVSATVLATPEGINDVDQLRSDVQRLTLTVDALQHRLAESSSTGDPTTDHTWRSATVGVLVVLALFVGWVAGSAYGRQSERSRRSRIRF
ncbi:MAG TPA: SH3 domain-containing protein [Candidatus Binatia bacterium]|nr:SH3 domain-containing protein [Candidatus Binatia bacterium]